MTLRWVPSAGSHCRQLLGGHVPVLRCHCPVASRRRWKTWREMEIAVFIWRQYMGFMLDAAGRWNLYGILRFMEFIYTCTNEFHATYGILHACVHASIHTSIHPSIHTYMHICIHTYTFIHTCTHTRIHTYTNTHTYAHTHTDLHTCIHACMHTYIHIIGWNFSRVRYCWTLEGWL